MKLKVMFNSLMYQMYSDRRGNGQKQPPDETFQTEDPLTKRTGQKTPRKQLRENLYRGLMSWFLQFTDLQGVLVTARAREFWMSWRRSMYLGGVEIEEEGGAVV